MNAGCGTLIVWSLGAELGFEQSNPAMAAGRRTRECKGSELPANRFVVQVKHLKQVKYGRKHLAKNKKTVNRAYGGVLSGGAVRERVVRAFLVEEQKIVKVRDRRCTAPSLEMCAGGLSTFQGVQSTGLFGSASGVDAAWSGLRVQPMCLGVLMHDLGQVFAKEGGWLPVCFGLPIDGGG